MLHWIPIFPWPLICGTGSRFTNGFSIAIQIRWKFRFTITSILIQWLLQNFAHGTTAVLHQTWLTFGDAPLYSNCFIASDWSSSFRTFEDKLLFGLSSNLVGELIMGLSRPDQPLATFCQILTISWPLICRAPSVHLLTNCWSDWLQCWWVNSSWDSPCLMILSRTNFYPSAPIGLEGYCCRLPGGRALPHTVTALPGAVLIGSRSNLVGTILGAGSRTSSFMGDVAR